MPQLVEASSYFEELPDFQREQVMNLIDNRGYDENSYLTALPVAITPDGESILHVSLRPFGDDVSYVAVSPTDSVSMTDYLTGNDYEYPPVMDKQDMMILAR